MANIFTLEKLDDFAEKINIDDLYESKKQKDLNKLALFQKILNRVHVRIKTTSKQKLNEPFCWFVVPEVMIGVPRYDQAECIAYLMDKLQDNGFKSRYIHPNTLLISWQHWVPSYVRTELKKRTGIVINEFGEKMDEHNDDNPSQIQLHDNTQNINSLLLNKDKNTSKPIKKYTPIDSYKPTGNLFY